jgi:hypothetical protein
MALFNTDSETTGRRAETVLMQALLFVRTVESYFVEINHG